jgi:hypothetical protein
LTIRAPSRRHLLTIWIDGDTDRSTAPINCSRRLRIVVVELEACGGGKVTYQVLT